VVLVSFVPKALEPATIVSKSIKIVLAVLVGFVVWFVVATVANLLTRASVAGYAEAETAAQFTLPMLLARLAVGGLSSVAAGFACALCARAIPTASKVLAVALVLFFVPVHYALWVQFPLWYHAVFLVSLAPLVLVGAVVGRHLVWRGRGAA
jgi:hypothetical protein